MRVAVIGCGSIGRRHLENLLSLGVRDILIHDRDPETLWRSGIDPCIRACPELNALWDKQPDAVSICTPPWLHVEQAKQAIEHNCHVFIEKPLCHSLQDARALVEMLAGNDLVNMVACNWRYHDGPLRLRHAFDMGLLCKPLTAAIWHHSYLPDWVPGRNWREHYSASKEHGGVLFEVGWHLVDLTQFLFGDVTLEHQHIRTVGHEIDCDSYAHLLLAREDAQIDVHAHFMDPHGKGLGITVAGGICDQLSWTQDDSRARGYDDNGMYKAEIADFLQCCQEGRPSPNPISQAVTVLEILLKAKEMAG